MHRAWFTGHTVAVNALATAAVDGRSYVISGGGDGRVHAWDLTRWQDGGERTPDADQETPSDLAATVSTMYGLMLRNVASDSNVITDLAGVAGSALPGCVIASPSAPGGDGGIHNYVYNWTRDAAMVAMELSAAGLVHKQPLTDYVRFAMTCQNALETNVDRGCYLINGDPRPWTNQADGPALQTLAVLRLFGQLGKATRAIALAVIQRNLDFLEYSYEDGTYNLWEDRYGRSFFTLAVQLKCLRAVASNQLGLPVPPWSTQAMRWLENALAAHWNGTYYESVFGEPVSPSRRPYDPNIDVVMAAVYGAADPADPRMLATAGLLRAQWADPGSAYYFPINAADGQRDIGPMLGRYPGDSYDGGPTGPGTGDHPWAISTACFAEFYYLLADRLIRDSRVPVDDLSRSFFSQVGVTRETPTGEAAAALRSAGDKMLRAIVFHSDHLELSELFDATTGFARGARSLSWSYAAFLSALRARDQIGRR